MKCIMYLQGYTIFIRIECEFTSNETGGSRMKEKSINVISICIVWQRDHGLKESISKLKCLLEVIT